MYLFQPLNSHSIIVVPRPLLQVFSYALCSILMRYMLTVVPERRRGNTELRVPAGPARAFLTTEAEEGRDPVRVSVAIEVGAFLRRAYNGEHRGTSGRDKVSQASRYYSWPRTVASASALLVCTPNCSGQGPLQAGAGRSVFIGLPTLWETSLALREAGFEWPAGGVDAERASGHWPAGGGRGG